MQINTILREIGEIEYNTLGEIVKIFKTFNIPYPHEMVTAIFKAGCLVKHLNKDAKVVLKINPEKPAYYRIMEEVYVSERGRNKERSKKRKKGNNKEVVKQPVTSKAKRVSSKITTASEAFKYFAEMESNVINALETCDNWREALDKFEIQRLREELSRVDNIRNQYHEALEIIGFDFDNRTFPFYDVLDQNIAKHGDTMILEYLKYRGYKIMKPVKYEEV